MKSPNEDFMSTEWQARARGIIEAQTAAANAAQVTTSNPYSTIAAVSSASLRRALADAGVVSDAGAVVCALCEETFARYSDATRECCTLCKSRRRHPGEWLEQKVTTWSGNDYIQHFEEGWSCCGSSTEKQWSGCTFAAPHVVHAERFYAAIQFVNTDSWKADLKAAGARLEAQYDATTVVGGLSAEATACVQRLPDPSPTATEAVCTTSREMLAKFVASGGKHL